MLLGQAAWTRQGATDEITLDDQLPINIKSFGAYPDDGLTDLGAAINRAKAAGHRTIVIDEGAGAYHIKSQVSFVNGLQLIAGKGMPTVKLNAAIGSSRCFLMPSVTDWAIEGIEFDGAAAYTANDAAFVISGTSARGRIERCVFRSMPSAPSTGSIAYSGAGVSDCWFLDNTFIDSVGVSVGLNAAYGCLVAHNIFRNSGNWCVAIIGNATHNVVDSNRCYDSTLEAIVTQNGSDRNQIIGNHCEGCGDNGISISGSHNLVVGNHCYNNDHAGIGIWGSYNTIVGNVCKNNAKVLPYAAWSAGASIGAIGTHVYNVGNEYTSANTGTTANNGPTHTTGTVADGGGVQWTYVGAITIWGGIWVNSGFGGCGQFNTISGNVTDDDQTIAGQCYNVRIESTGYANWAAGATITSGSYRVQGLNVYQATTNGTTGATAPTWTGGTTDTDGGVSWKHVNTFRSSAITRGNIVSGHISGRMKYSTQFSDQNSWSANSLYASQQVGQSLSQANDDVGFSSFGTGYWYVNQRGFVRQKLSGTSETQTGISAAGSTQSDATALTGLFVEVSTVGSGQGVKLPTFAVQKEFVIANFGVNDLKIYPPTSSQINALGANAAFTLTAGKTARFWCTSTTRAIGGMLN